MPSAKANAFSPRLERDPVVRTAHPRWLQKALKALWPEQWEAICAANNAHPPMILRVNRRHHSRDAYLAELLPRASPPTPCVYSRDGIVARSAADVRSLPGFAEGWISVQDEAAQLAADLLDLAPGQRVLDACCAPGGKTCHILEAEPALAGVVAVDLEAKRLVRVRENLERLGLSAELIAADGRDTATWWDGKPFQRILLDAPCSATGVIRRHPDIKLTRQPDDIAALAQSARRVARRPVANPGSRRHPALRHLLDAADGKQRRHRRLPRPHPRCPRAGSGYGGAASNSPTVASCWPSKAATTASTTPS